MALVKLIDKITRELDNDYLTRLIRLLPLNNRGAEAEWLARRLLNLLFTGSNTGGATWSPRLDYLTVIIVLTSLNNRYLTHE